MRPSEPGEVTHHQADRGFLPSPEHKVRYVRVLFARIARRYDRMNRIMTLGRDRAWRRYAVEESIVRQVSRSRADVESAGSVLDVATGTGDLALEVLRRRPAFRVVGIDSVSEMLALARQKASALAHKFPESAGRTHLWLAAGDALHLPFADATFDHVITGFALRNVADIPAAFAEMARVTRLGGRIACLEIAKPRRPLIRWLFALYFYRLVPLLGRWVAGERTAYSYLPHSLTAFLTPEQITQVMERTGWSDVRSTRLTLGTVAVQVGVRKRG